jgi:site-specific recombinase XerD
MKNATQTQGTFTVNIQEADLFEWIEAFLVDRQATGTRPGTLRFYRMKLLKWLTFCETQILTKVGEITPGHIREYLLFLQNEGHNPGGIHAHYRSLKTFLRWLETELEPVNWRNPIRKVKAPRVDLEPLDPISTQDFRRLLDTCNTSSFIDTRDMGIFLMLLDTGLRAGELLALNKEDIDNQGAILVRQSKSRKPRTVFGGGLKVSDDRMEI